MGSRLLGVDDEMPGTGWLPVDNLPVLSSIARDMQLELHGTLDMLRRAELICGLFQWQQPRFGCWYTLSQQAEESQDSQAASHQEFPLYPYLSDQVGVKLWSKRAELTGWGRISQPGVA